MSLRQRALQGLAWSFLEKWGRKGISLVVFVVLARMLQPDAFGLVALASVYISLMGVLIDQGFAAAVVQREQLEPEHLDTALWTNLGLSTLLAVAGVVAARPIAALLNEPGLAPVLRGLSPVLCFSALSRVQEAILRRDLNFKVLSTRSLVAQAAGGTVGVGMALTGFGVWSLVAQQLVAGAAGVLVLWTASPWRPRLRFSIRHFKELAGFGTSVMGTSVLNFINRRSDDLLIGAFLGSTALGYYTIAYRVLLTLTDVLTSVSSQVVFPVFSRLQQDPARMLRAFYTAVRYTSLATFPVFLGLAAVAPEVVVVLFGPQWAPSVPVMRILALIGILHSVYYFNASVMLANGKASWRLWLNTLNAVGNLVGFAIAVRWGISAVAAAYVIRGYLLSPLPLWAVRRLIGLDVVRYLRLFAVPFAASLLMIAAILGVRLVLGEEATPLVHLIAMSGAGGSVYLLSVYAMVPALAGEVRRITSPLLTGLR